MQIQSLILCTGIQLTLSPMTVAPVCRVGDSLQLTCKLAATVESIQILQWSFMVVNDNGELEEITAYSNRRDSSQQLTERVINSTTFTVVRSSRQNATPLISTLSINATNIGLNGTIVHCMDTRSTSSPASTTIYIVDVIKSELAVTINFINTNIHNNYCRSNIAHNFRRVWS